MEKIIISNPAALEKTKKLIKKGGADKLHIISDFDGTLTRIFVDGKRRPSLISILRDENYLPQDYRQKSKALFAKFHPYETNQKINLDKREKAMDEWWEKQFKQLIVFGFNKKILEKVMFSGKIKLRKKCQEFIKLLYLNRIPLVIMSSTGLGGEAISLCLQKNKRFYNNIYIISNFFKWDKDGKAIGFAKPIIHSLNKNEIIVKSFPKVYGKIKDRKNVLLLGNIPEDIEMIKGFNYYCLLKIGFLNEKVKKNLKTYKRFYDILILNDGSMKYVNKLLEELLN